MQTGTTPGACLKGAALVCLAIWSGGIVAADEPQAAALLGMAVDAQELSEQRGREGINIDDVVAQLNDVRADATINDNVLNSQQTGGNTVAADAFSNASGLVFSVQNSGNNVVIQNTTLINVNLQP